MWSPSDLSLSRRHCSIGALTECLVTPYRGTLEFKEELDKTPTGKLRKQDLRDAGVTNLTWDRESVGYVVPR